MFVAAPRSLFAFPVPGNEKVTVYDPTSGWPYVAADCAARDFRSGGSDMRGWFWQQGRVCGRTTYDQRHHNPSLEVPAVSTAGFHDTFSGPDGQPLAGRRPETTASTNSIWFSPATTNWRTKGGALVLDATANRDFRAVNDVGRPRNWVHGRIVREAGMAGLVIRYSDKKTG